MNSTEARLAASLSDRYRIIRELGQGGMATVYLAEDLKHHRQVAIKVLRPELAAALGADRFLREIETTANLRHPHILPLFDSGAVPLTPHSSPLTPQLLFYVMPYVDGESLRSRLDREKQLPIDDALQVAREVADALSYAHAHGVIHRDIKPENILLESGHAVVADFGIARAINAASGDQLTETGMAIGTVQYMSPEQAAGQRDLDGRSDLYALGCVLYEMLAGQAPFTGPTVESIIHQHMVANPPPITQLRPAVPADVAAALQRALAKTPADRFNPVAQFASALQPRSMAATAPVAASAPRSRALLIGATLAALAALGLFVARSRGAAGNVLPVVGKTTQVTRDPGLEVDPALSPDGESIAYAAGPATAMQLYVRQVSGGRAVALTSDTTGNFRWPRWSPDGSQIAFQAGDGIFVVPALGGPARRLSHLDPVAAQFSAGVSAPMYGFDWSPDGTRIAWALGFNSDRITVLTLATGDTLTLPAPYAPFAPAWSPDGRNIAVAAGNGLFNFGTVFFGNQSPAAIWLVHLDGSSPTPVTSDSSLSTAPQWSPDGHELYWISDRDGNRDVYRRHISNGGAPEGIPQRLTTGTDAQGLSVSRHGKRLAYSRLTTWSAIWSLPIPASGTASIRNATRVTPGNEAIESADISNDGRWLAFDSDRNGNFDIYVMPATGGEARQITTDPADDFNPHWSPDGRRVAFHSLRNGNRDIFVVGADGTGLRQLTTALAEENDADWSPDGSRIVLELLGGPTAPHALVIMPADGTSPADTIDIDETAFAHWSPDSRSLLYHSKEGVTVRNLATGVETLVASTARDGAKPLFPIWSPDGKYVYYLSQGPKGWSVRSVPATGGASRTLVDFDDLTRQHTRYGFATDGKFFYFTLGSPESDIWVADLTKP